LNVSGVTVDPAIKSNASATSNSETIPSTRVLPPHLRHLRSQPGTTISGYVPPHLLSSVPASTASSVSNPYENASTIGEPAPVHSPVAGPVRNSVDGPVGGNRPAGMFFPSGQIYYKALLCQDMHHNKIDKALYLSFERKLTNFSQLFPSLAMITLALVTPNNVSHLVRPLLNSLQPSHQSLLVVATGPEL